MKKKTDYLAMSDINGKTLVFYGKAYDIVFQYLSKVIFVQNLQYR